VGGRGGEGITIIHCLAQAKNKQFYVKNKTRIESWAIGPYMGLAPAQAVVLQDCI
jgi:hypothetical protein